MLWRDIFFMKRHKYVMKRHFPYEISRESLHGYIYNSYFSFVNIYHIFIHYLFLWILYSILLKLDILKVIKQVCLSHSYQSLIVDRDNWPLIWNLFKLAFSQTFVLLKFLWLSGHCLIRILKLRNSTKSIMLSYIAAATN
jgi:hypothetical protein